MLATNFTGTFLFCGNRHCPSSAIRADNKFPLLSSIMVLVLVLNRGEGSENQNQMKRMKIMNVLIPFLLLINVLRLENCKIGKLKIVKIDE